MKENEKIVLFTTDHEFSEEDYKDYCEDNDIAANNFDDWRCREEEYAQEDDLFDLEKHGLTGNPNDIYLVEGMVGTWQGAMPGGRVDKIHRMIHTLGQNEDYIELYTDDSGTYIDSANHDASSHFNVWLITDKAKKFLKDLMDSDKTKSRKEYHNILLNTEGFLRPVTREMVEGRWGTWQSTD